jgi:hypothetical protein
LICRFILTLLPDFSETPGDPRLAYLNFRTVVLAAQVYRCKGAGVPYDRSGYADKRRSAIPGPSLEEIFKRSDNADHLKPILDGGHP